jgi:hypothetical protein
MLTNASGYGTVTDGNELLIVSVMTMHTEKGVLFQLSRTPPFTPCANVMPYNNKNELF